MNTYEIHKDCNKYVVTVYGKDMETIEKQGFQTESEAKAFWRENGELLDNGDEEYTDL